VNAARGGVVDELALVESGHPFIIDTWEGEPCINRAVVEKAELASFHIAGYSAEGKFNASQMCLAAFCQHFGTPILSIDKKVVSLQAKYGDTAPGWLKRVSDQLKAAPEQFEQLRKQYKLR
ncbi:MAG: erythronate-4-phosphate dehydrogenase, partial [Paludibacteraceae bacterium]|nr:erythronate-4-phosphate dehydrogenase [Paludibacteraceae bacterium]